MRFKTSLQISSVAALLFGVEIFLWFGTGMHKATGAGSTASLIALQFGGLMILTLGAGILAPAAALIEEKSGTERIGLILWVGSLGLLAVAFIAFSFLRAPAATTMPRPQAVGEVQKDISQYLEYVDTEINAQDPETLKMILKFRNKSSEDVTELDYVLVAVEDAQIFYKIKIREAVYFPSKQEGSTTLTWQRSKLKSPELFDRLLKADKEKKLRIFAKPARITLVSGAVIGE